MRRGFYVLVLYRGKVHETCNARLFKDALVLTDADTGAQSCKITSWRLHG